MGGELDTAPPDHLIAALAERQHGVASVAQMLRAGVTLRQIDRRAQSGRLHRVHRGVYAVGHPLLTQRGRWMAAVLAVGEGAVLSHRSAAALWDLAAPGPVVEVLVSRRAVSRKGIRVRGSADIESTVVDGIPVTTVARTLLDYAGTASRHAAERACDQAEHLQLFDLSSLEAVLLAHPNHGGATTLKTILQAHQIGTMLTRSELEERFRAFCDRHGLPRPECNFTLPLPSDQITPDFYWPHAGLAVETDGWSAHRTRRAFEEDRRRDAVLVLAGYRVVRFTWRQITDEPKTVARTLRALLRRPRAGGPARP